MGEGLVPIGPDRYVDYTSFANETFFVDQSWVQ